MKALRHAIDEVLRQDVIIQILVGELVYEGGIRRVKVFEFPVDRQAEAPYIAWHILPGGDVDGHYGDLNGQLLKTFQVSCWGRTKDEADEVFEAVVEVFESQQDKINVLLAPEYLMALQRMGDESPIPDQDTTWTQVPSTWVIMMGR